MKNKIFLGGTCNNTSWREELINVLQVDYFNPVVEDWTPDCQQTERKEKHFECNIHLYVITNAMTGVFSIAEAIESAMTPGKLTILSVIPDGFLEFQLMSLDAVCEMVKSHGGIAFIDCDLMRVARILNQI